MVMTSGGLFAIPPLGREYRNIGGRKSPEDRLPAPFGRWQRLFHLIPLTPLGVRIVEYSQYWPFWPFRISQPVVSPSPSFIGRCAQSLGADVGVLPRYRAFRRPLYRTPASSLRRQPAVCGPAARHRAAFRCHLRASLRLRLLARCGAPVGAAAAVPASAPPSACVSSHSSGARRISWFRWGY